MTNNNYRAARTISAVLKTEQDVDRVIRHWLEGGVERDDSSVIEPILLN